MRLCFKNASVTEDANESSSLRAIERRAPRCRRVLDSQQCTQLRETIAWKRESHPFIKIPLLAVELEQPP